MSTKTLGGEFDNAITHEIQKALGKSYAWSSKGQEIDYRGFALCDHNQTDYERGIIDAALRKCNWKLKGGSR